MCVYTHVDSSAYIYREIDRRWLCWVTGRKYPRESLIAKRNDPIRVYVRAVSVHLVKFGHTQFFVMSLAKGCGLVGLIDVDGHIP